MLTFDLIFGALMTLIVYTAYILVISFVLWMTVDAAKQDRYWWVILIIGVPLVGAAVYYFTEKKHVYAEAPSHHIHTSETEEQHEVAHKKHVSRDKDDSVSVKEEEKKEENS